MQIFRPQTPLPRDPLKSCAFPVSTRTVDTDASQWGSNNAITDITKAADWQILGCDPNALSQDIRLVCMNDPDDPNSKCGHLYQEIGAVNKIVRLPEDVRACFIFSASSADL